MNKLIIAALLVAFVASQDTALTLTQGWYRGRVSRYYEFGLANNANSVVNNQVAVPRIWVLSLAEGQNFSLNNFISEFDSTNAGYSGLWTRVNTVFNSMPSPIPNDVAGITATNAAFTNTVQNNTYINCPIINTNQAIADISSLPAGEERTQMQWEGHADGTARRCVYLGTNPRSLIPIYLFNRPDNTNAPNSNIIDRIPGEAGYSDFWNVILISVAQNYTSGFVSSKCQLGNEEGTAGPNVNCPVVHTENAVTGTLTNQLVLRDGTTVSSDCASVASASALTTSLVVIGGVITALFF